VSWLCEQKLFRLQEIVAERTQWSSQLAQVSHMHDWVLSVEHILDGSWTQPAERVSNKTVGSRLDSWREQMAGHLTDGTLTELEQECLTQFLQVFSNLRPHLVQCYNRKNFPRTNNDMERCIRALKTQYRRVSGRKNWNGYLLRYGRCVAYATWWEQDPARHQQLEQRAAQLNRTRWRQLRRETTTAQREQLQRFRFLHQRESYLATLEQRWAAVAPTQPLP